MVCKFKLHIKGFGHTECLKRSDIHSSQSAMKNHLSLTEQRQNHLFPQTCHYTPSILI